MIPGDGVILGNIQSVILSNNQSVILSNNQSVILINDQSVILSAAKDLLFPSTHQRSQQILRGAQDDIALGGQAVVDCANSRGSEPVGKLNAHPQSYGISTGSGTSTGTTRGSG